MAVPALRVDGLEGGDVRATCDAFDALPPDLVLGWCAVIIVAFAVVAHLAQWRRE